MRYSAWLIPRGGDCRWKRAHGGAAGEHCAGAAADESCPERQPVQHAGANAEPEMLRPGMEQFTGLDELDQPWHQHRQRRAEDPGRSVRHRAAALLPNAAVVTDYD